MRNAEQLGEASCRHDKLMERTYSDRTITQDERALKSIARAISFSQQRFSLILVRCEHEDLKQSALQLLQEKHSLDIEILTLPESTRNLYSTIQLWCKNEQPSALMVLGLETITHLDEVLVSTNQMRNEFRRTFHFPLVLWIDDRVLQKLVRLAPDFYSWAGVPIQL